MSTNNPYTQQGWLPRLLIDGKHIRPVSFDIDYRSQEEEIREAEDKVLQAIASGKIVRIGGSQSAKTVELKAVDSISLMKQEELLEVQLKAAKSRDRLATCVALINIILMVIWGFVLGQRVG